MTLSTGTKLGRYEIRSKIGEGGMGEVYLAEDSKLNRKVAIKVLPAAFSQDEERLRRFEQEAQAASALNHPNILVLYDVGTHEGAPYVVSELLEGETLRERTTGGSVAQRRVIDYALQIAHGLAAAHEKGIVHRDLKPENLFDAQGNRDVWIIDLASGNRTRFTFDPGTDIFAIWSPDGSRIAFASDREGARNLYQKSASGAGKEELLLKADLNSLPLDWSADGRFIVYIVNAPKTKLDTWVFPVSGDQKPFPFLQSEANERNAKFSPDGRWIAYTSDESGMNQIYVQSFPDSGGKRQVSTNGGYHLAWRRDGKELFYIDSDKKMMAVDVRGEGPTFEVGTPKTLFDLRVPSFNSAQAQFAVNPDGQKFLVANTAGEITSAPINIVLNWTADLKR